MDIVAGIWGLWTAAAVAGEVRHRRALGRLPHRFLVNGIRGKSSLTRLLHGALADAGVRALGRTTGDDPVVLLPNGGTELMRRRGAANIREMRRLPARALREGCTALCVENMAVRPELVRVVAGMMVRPTISLFAWDGADHLEHYPAEAGARARLLAASFTPGTRAVVIEDPRNTELVAALRARGLDCHTAGTADPTLCGPERRAGQLADAVLATLALAGIEGVPDRETLGARAREMTRLPVVARDGRAYIDLLSANDLDSTRELMSDADHEVPAGDGDALVFFHRADRPGRLLSFLPLLRGRRSFVAGDPVPGRLLRGSGIRALADPGAILRLDACRIFLLGNTHGMGHAVRAVLRAAEGEAR